MAKVINLKRYKAMDLQEVIQDFLFWKKATGVRERMLSDYDLHIRMFFNWNTLRSFLIGVKENLIPENPLSDIKKRKDENRIVNIEPQILTSLFNLPDKATFPGLRDYALFLLTLDTGIRPKEAFYLLNTDINLRSLEIYIRADVSKTNIKRTVPISLVTAQAIKATIESRHIAWKENVSIFCSIEGNPLNRYTWGERLKKYSKLLGVKSKFCMESSF